MSALSAGKRLYSAVSSVELIVVKPADVTLEIQGQPVTDSKPQGVPTGGGTGILLGKRYTDEQSGLLVMCTKTGEGPITADGRELQLVATQALPSSD